MASRWSEWGPLERCRASSSFLLPNSCPPPKADVLVWMLHISEPLTFPSRLARLSPRPKSPLPPLLARLKHFVHNGNIIETGASVIYTGNAHLYNLTDRVHLNRLDPSEQEGPNTGLWNGKRFVLKTGSSSLANLARMAWRYGM